MRPVRVGVWGVGTWGEKHARVLSSVAEGEWVGVHDLDPARAAQVAARYGGRVFETPDALLGQCEAVTIAVPTIDHRACLERAAAAGCHALVEKPMSPSVEDADHMLRAARASGTALQVGHVERFNPALLAASPHLGAPRFIEAHRLALFQLRSLDIDVVFDLMIHDIDIALEAVGARPVQVSAVGVAVLSANEDIANARIEFEGGCVANLTASRVSQERLRRIRFFQSDTYLSVDLFEKSGDLLRVDPTRIAVSPREAIQRSRLDVPAGEPLTLELQAFLRSLRGLGSGAASGTAGREALRVAAEVRDAMKRRAQQWAVRSSAVS